MLLRTPLSGRTVSRRRGGFEQADFGTTIEPHAMQVANASGDVYQPFLPFVQSFHEPMILDRGKGGPEKRQDALPTVGMSAKHEVPVIGGK
jgi:hypothetical protein